MPRQDSVKRPWIQSKPRVKQEGRKAESQAVYKPNRWKETSAQHRRANPYCVECLKEKKFTDCSPGTNAGVTDHIVPIAKGGDQWDPANFQTLCHRHHNAKSARDK
ncbi:hypothetical protein GCM10027299_21370 [Larkinella ripae]